MRVLVTGSNGLVGSRLSKLLEGQGHEVLGVSRGEGSATGASRFDAAEPASTGEGGGSDEAAGSARRDRLAL